MRFVLFLSLLLLVGAAATADEVYVPGNNPSSGGSNAIPFWAEWSAIQGQIRYQALYDPTQLGNKPFRISDMAFASNYDGSFSATQLQIRFSHSTVGTLNASMDLNLPAPVVMFDGAFQVPTTVNQWSSMGLKGTFDYNGVDYLVVDVRYMGGKSVLTGAGSQGRFRSAPIHRSWAYQNYYATTESGQDRLAGIYTRFTVNTTTILGSGNARPGNTITFTLNAPGDAGLPYQVGTSLGMGPIPIDTRLLGLSLDSVLQTSVTGVLPTIFQDYAGVLDAQGQGTAKLNLPNLSALVGVRLYSAFLTLKVGAPSNVSSISDTFQFTILQ
jgi:hypothetical protein